MVINKQNDNKKENTNMNITDIKDSEIGSIPEGSKATSLHLTPWDRLEHILEAQKILMVKYHTIEKSNGLLLDECVPVNIDSPLGQARIKDFMWRVTEELTESYEAFLANNHIHYIEEIVDALHFFTELMIITGLTYRDVSKYCQAQMISRPKNENEDDLQDMYNMVYGSETPEMDYWNITYKLGLAANCLKQKAWKQTHVFTDREKFNNYLAYAFVNFIGLCKTTGITSTILYDTYFKKNQVNHFRIRSNY
jgi:dimeric dUTPase (all-alpha-NTP-PPase superfamily)